MGEPRNPSHASPERDANDAEALHSAAVELVKAAFPGSAVVKDQRTPRRCAGCGRYVGSDHRLCDRCAEQRHRTVSERVERLRREP
jgi:rRNA maturation endonuclease Nob1